jgi:hypothetical protein
MDSMTFDELDDLLESVRGNADQQWQDAAMQCLRALAATGEPFTADEVHDLMRPYGVTTASENAMGAMFNKARREGVIVSDGMYRPSERRDAHRRMVRIWKGAA